MATARKARTGDYRTGPPVSKVSEYANVPDAQHDRLERAESIAGERRSEIANLGICEYFGYEEATACLMNALRRGALCASETRG